MTLARFCHCAWVPVLLTELLPGHSGIVMIRSSRVGLNPVGSPAAIQAGSDRVLQLSRGGNSVTLSTGAPRKLANWSARAVVCDCGLTPELQGSPLARVVAGG